MDRERDFEFYPNQKASESNRKALGATGAAQFQTPIEPGSPRLQDPDRAKLAKLSDLFAPNGGFYVAAALSGTADQAATDTKAGSKSSLAMPEGQTVAGSDQPSIFYNMMEDGHSSHYLRPGVFVPGVRTGGDKDRNAMVLAGMVPSFEHLFWVDLVKDGGQDAQWSGSTFISAVSYTYTAKVAFSTTQKLGEKLSPVIRLVDHAPTSQATMGIGCFLGANFYLVFTNETPNQTNCST